MEKFASFLFSDPFRFFGIVIVVCLFVIFIPKLHRLFHYVNPPPIADTPDKVTLRQVLAEPIEAEKHLVFQNARFRSRSAVDADTLDALSYTAFAQTIANLRVAGEDTALASALSRTLHQYAIATNMSLIDAQAYSKTEADKTLEVRIKKLLDSAEASHHRKMKITDIDIRKMAFLVKKELEKDSGLSGQAIPGATS